MKRFGGFLSQKVGGNASKSMTALDEPKALEDALAAAKYIINDEVDKAESELSKGTSPFHKLGLSTALFLRATLGFEKEIMVQASSPLADAEASADEHRRRAVRDPSTAHHSAIYPAGAEYALCHAETQLMSAVVGVLNESLTEALRGFYKLRKAFATLYEISEAEKRYLQAHGKLSRGSKESLGGGRSGKTSLDEPPAYSSGALTPVTGDEKDDDDDLDFMDAEEASGGSRITKGYEGHLDTEAEFEKMRLEDTVTSKLNGAPRAATEPSVAPTNSASFAAQADQDIDFREITSDPIDVFIHSGTALCFGLLQLLLSMIPPAFARILQLFSFRGDRAAGMRMLWSATKFKHNINGAMAGLIVLGFHNGAIAFCDVLAKDALPMPRLRALLKEMRGLYPGSKLWLLEEARMLALDHNLEEAVKVQSQESSGGLKQVEALRVFERSLNLMFLHRYEECAESFIKCVGLNNWSHALYYYIAGACYVELYRTYKTSNPKRAEEYAMKADKYLHMVPSNMGKKKLLGRQLPFDLFVNRKISKWDHRAKAWHCSFVDALGVSPIEEMAYFWSGYKRMGEKQLRQSLDRLAWYETVESNPNWERESIDEKAILAVLTATCLRFLGNIKAAKSTITDSVLAHDPTQIKASGESADTYPLPVAHYEMACCLWEEAGHEDGDKGLLKECSEELAKVEKWETYDLETRVGLKVTTARETLRRAGIGGP